ncbi:MAG: tyrosine-type recombinase/integrase [Bacteroidetes bacterium]|nr:tyrosine-type recombinase/integrase [Bacteroidota bacterium]
MSPHIQSFLSYIQYERRYSPHTLESYQNDLEQLYYYLKTEYQKEEIELATHLEIRSWMVSMMEKEISPRSINRKLSTLKSFFKFLMRKGVVKKSPLAKVLAPKTAKRLPVFVEKNGIDKLMKEVEFPESFEGARDRIILELLYGTGMRRSELLGLRETDLDSYHSQVKVLGKGNKERIIPIQPELRDAVKEYITHKNAHITHPSLYLFVDDEGRQLNASRVYATVKKYLNLVTTINKKSPHVLRHTYATHLMNNGADINAVKELLGHASLAATQVYTHNTIDKLKNIYKQAHPKA